MLELKTILPDLELVEPNVERDAPASVTWLNSEYGRETMRLMGNVVDDLQPTTLLAEQQRIRDFLTATDQLTWSIRYKNKTVGAVWVSLAATQYVPAPSIHIMLGDPASRGKGLGTATFQAVIGYLHQEHEYPKLYSRHLLDNNGSAALLAKLGFQNTGSPYRDTDDLQFQNVMNELLNGVH